MSDSPTSPPPSSSPPLQVPAASPLGPSAPSSGPTPPNPGPALDKAAARDAAPAEPLDRLAVRTTAATALGSIGALLLVIAAGTFIAVNWDHLGLLGKASIVASLAVAAIGAGHILRDRLPGTAGVLTHLGAALIPLDVGGVAVAFGADRPTTGVLAGLAGIVGFIALDRKLIEHGADLRSREVRLTDIGAVGGRAMAAGRTISGSAFLLGLSATVGLRPAVMMLAIAATLAAIRAASESIGLALVAGASPIARWAGQRSLDGSFFDELAEISAASALETTIVGVGALVVIAGTAMRHRERWLSIIAGAIVAASAAPDAASIFADHQQTTLIFVSAGLLAARSIVWLRRTSRFGSIIDIAVMLTSMAGLAIGLVASESGGIQPDIGLAVVAILLGASWLVSDASANVSETLARRLWSGASGPVSGIGIAVAAVLGAFATASVPWAATILLVVALAVGLAPRMMAPTVAAAMTILAVVVSLIEPGDHVLVGLAAAIVLQGRAMITYNEGRIPVNDTAIAQWLGAGLAITTLLVTPVFGPHGLVPAALSFATAVGLAAVAHRWVGIAQFDWPPRLLMVASTVPAFDNLSQAGIALTVVGLALTIEALVRDKTAMLVFGAPTMVLGSWLWAEGEGLMAAEWYIAAPALLAFAYGLKTSRSGASSWGGMPIGVTLLAGVALLERVDSAILHENLANPEVLGTGSVGVTSGWHAVVAGLVSILALTLGVERKWQGPTATGLVFLIATVVIEAGAVVPLVPVWVLLGVGGVMLLGAGLALERGAQRSAAVAIDGHTTSGGQASESGPLATLTSTWAEFR